MKFLADMGISPRTVEFLRDLGHDAVHLHELGLERLADSQVLRKARDENRILLTHDLDFAELVAYSETGLPSVVVFRLKSMRPDNVNRYMEHIVLQHGQALKDGVIVSVTEGQARIRTLPFDRSGV